MLKVLLAVVTCVCLMEFNPAGEYQYVTHTVKTGETVWNIAEQYAPAQAKPFNEFVFEISDANKLRGKYIQPGDRLTIPLWVKKGR